MEIRGQIDGLFCMGKRALTTDGIREEETSTEELNNDEREKEGRKGKRRR